MSEYEPELGQALFGQPYKEHAVSDFVEAVLSMIGHELERVMGNEGVRNWQCPFSNTGAEFVCPAFEVHAYSWGDDDQPFNFKWGDVEISWYKYLGRGMSANQEINPDRASQMLNECLAYLRERDRQNLEMRSL